LSRLAFSHVHGPMWFHGCTGPEHGCTGPNHVFACHQLQNYVVTRCCVYTCDMHAMCMRNACLWISAASITSCQWLFEGALLPVESMQAGSAGMNTVPGGGLYGSVVRLPYQTVGGLAHHLPGTQVAVASQLNSTSCAWSITLLLLQQTSTAAAGLGIPHGDSSYRQPVLVGTSSRWHLVVIDWTQLSNSRVT
jgi:hypothetical protein